MCNNVALPEICQGFFLMLSNEMAGIDGWRGYSVADSEIFEFSCGRLFNVMETTDSGAGRTLLAPDQHLIDIRLLSLENGFYAPVGQVSHPACQIEASGSSLRGGAEENALYAAGNDKK
jgi:hypothetical protein